MAAFGTYAYRAPAILSPSNGLEIVPLCSQATLRLGVDGLAQPGRGLLRWDRIDIDNTRTSRQAPPRSVSAQPERRRCGNGDATGARQRGHGFSRLRCT